MTLFCVAGIPRGLITATDSTPLNRSPSSRVMRFLTFLLMITPRVSGLGRRVSGQRRKRLRLHPKPEPRYPNPDLLDVQLHRRRHRGLDHDLLEERALARRRLELADVADHRVDVLDQLRVVEAHLADHAVHVAAGVVAEFHLAGGVLA